MATELRVFSPARRLLGASAVASLALMLASCDLMQKPPAMPLGLASPYGETTEVVWAVAPLRNESGTSLVDEVAVADTLRNQLTEVRGIAALPVNRTINAMRALGMASVDTPADALRLAEALDADAIVIGSVTSWQPYAPPQIGLNLALFANGRSMRQERQTMDPIAMQIAVTDMAIDGASDEPVSAIAVQLDGASNDVRCHVFRYAEGRHDPSSAMGPDRYLKSMTEFEKFACFRATELLLEQERQRLAQDGMQEQASAR